MNVCNIFMLVIFAWKVLAISLDNDHFDSFYAKICSTNLYRQLFISIVIFHHLNTTGIKISKNI